MKTAILTLALAMAASESAVAQSTQYSPAELLWWDTITEDWTSTRERFEDIGITWSLNFTGDLLGNPVGGMRQETVFASGLYGSIAFDMDKLLAIPGLTFHAAGSIQQGEDLSDVAIGNFFDVAEAFNGDVARLAQLYFEQSLVHDRVRIAVGRLSAGDDFATAESFGYYVNGAVDGTPAGILENFPSFTTPPFAQWGARITANPNDSLYFSAGAYNADPSVQDDDKHGLDFKLNPADGVLVLAEIGVSTSQGGSSRLLPGRYVIGGSYDSSDYEFLSDSTRTRAGNYGFYTIAEQMLYREGGPGSEQGLTSWAAVTFSPDQQINTLPLGIYGGAYYKGLFEGRDNDVTAFAFYYGSFSNELERQSAEYVVEFNHRFQISSSTYLTPDFQYVFRPNGGGIPDAAVFGFEASIDF